MTEAEEEQVFEGTVQWVGTLGSWPEETPEEMVLRIRPHDVGPARDGVHAVLVLMSMIKRDTPLKFTEKGWPTITPSEFARQMLKHKERFLPTLIRHAKTCRETELQFEIGIRRETGVL